MSDSPRRPILKLKFPPAAAPAPRPASAPAPPPEQVGVRWKCKPYGALVTVTGQESPDADVRCPTCNARLGQAGDFQKPEGAAPVVTISV